MTGKILLINPIYKCKDIMYFPLGLGYIAGACDKEGIEVKCLDMNVLEYNTLQVVDIIRKNDFHIVGIGGFSSQIKSTIELTNAIKNNFKDVIVIIGGIQAFGSEQFIMENSQADIICNGESEIILPKLIHTLYLGKDFSGTPSIRYRRRGELFRNEGFAIVPDLNEISFPKYDAFQTESYISNNYHSAPGKRTIDFICSRGCPFKCTFCINSKKPVKVRYRDPDNIVNEMRLLKEKYNINDFAFGDEIFSINKKRCLDICDAIKNEKITWLSSVRADGIDDEILLSMKGAGCRMLIIGFESGSENILKSMNKKVIISKYSEAIKLLRKHDIPFYSNFMIGMPEENEETIAETEKLCIDNGLIFGASYATPFPGSKLYDEVSHKIKNEKKYLFSLQDLNFAKKPIINLTKMPLKKLIFLRNRTILNTTTYLIHSKFNFIPLILIKAACWCYLSIFNINNSFISKIMRAITKRIYSLLGVSS